MWLPICTSLVVTAPGAICELPTCTILLAVVGVGPSIMPFAEFLVVMLTINELLGVRGFDIRYSYSNNRVCWPICCISNSVG